MLVDHLQKIKKEFKNLCKLVIQILFIKLSSIRLVLKHDMAYGKAKDLVRRTQSDIVLKDKAFKIASDPKYTKED